MSNPNRLYRRDRLSSNLRLLGVSGQIRKVKMTLASTVPTMGV